jgi:hypothetical protein
MRERFRFELLIFARESLPYRSGEPVLRTCSASIC